MKIAKPTTPAAKPTGMTKRKPKRETKRKRTRKPNPNRKSGGVPLLSCWIRDAATLEQITALVNSGARVSTQDSCGNQPLHYAASAGDVVDIAKFLVDKGANVLACNAAKKTPLDTARTCGAGKATIAFLEEAERAARDLKALK